METLIDSIRKEQELREREYRVVEDEVQTKYKIQRFVEGYSSRSPQGLLPSGGCGSCC